MKWQRTFALVLWTSLLAILTGCKGPSIDVTSDGKTVAVASDKGIRVHPYGSKAKGTLIYKGAAQDPRWSPNGKLIAFSDSTSTQVLNIATQTAHRLPKSNGWFAWTENSRYLSVVGDSSVSIFDAQSAKLVRKLAVDSRPSSVTLTNDGKTVIMGYGNELQVHSSGHTLRVPIKGSPDVILDRAQTGAWLVDYKTANDDLRYQTITIQLLQLQTGEVVNVADQADPRRILGTEDPALILGAFRTREGRLGLVGIADPSADQVSNQILDLEMKKGKTAEDNQRLDALYKNLLVDAKWVQLKRNGHFEKAIAEVKNLRVISNIPRDIRFGPDGRYCTLITPEDQARVFKLN